MDWHDAVNGSLPPPLEEEPVQLRRDIEDELADHLGCAYQQELGKSGNPAQAQQAAINRFGNPRKIARQLWFEAMKEKIMNQRIQMMTLVLLTVAIVAVLAFSWMSMQRAQETNQAMLAAITKLAGGGTAKAGAEANWSRLEVQVVGSKDNKPIAGIHVALTGQPFSDAKSQTMGESTDTKGSCFFGPIKPGVYTLKASKNETNVLGSTVPQAALFNKEIILYPGADIKKMVIHHPQPVMVPLKAKVDLPQEMQAQNLLFEWSIVGETNDPNGGAWTALYKFYFDVRGEQFSVDGMSRNPQGIINFQNKRQRQEEIPVTNLRLFQLRAYLREPDPSREQYREVLGKVLTNGEAKPQFTPEPGSQNEWLIHLVPTDLEYIQKRVANFKENFEWRVQEEEIRQRRQKEIEAGKAKENPPNSDQIPPPAPSENR